MKALNITLCLFLIDTCLSSSYAVLPEQPHPSSSVRVGAVQPKSHLIDWRLGADQALLEVDRNLDTIVAIIQQAATVGCDLLVFPEDTLGLLHWEVGNKQHLGKVLPKAVNRMLERLGRAGRSNQMYVACCSDTLESDGSYFNTSFLLNRQGEEIGRYHKVHPAIHESDRKKGESFPVIATPDLGDVGMLICYDMVMPESARSLALGGADIILLHTLGGAVTSGAPDVINEDINLAAFRTRAVENFVYLIISKRGSGALVISPQGVVLARGEGEDDIAIADIDPHSGREGGDALNSQSDMRARLFRERNPAAYDRLVEAHPPVLQKIPATITVEEAVRIGAGTLTIGQERFQKAEELSQSGQIEKALETLNELRSEYPKTWIDRAATKLSRELTSRKAAKKEPDP